MTNRLAFVLAGLIVAAILADLLLDHGTALMFLARKLVDLVEWMAFWR